MRNKLILAVNAVVISAIFILNYFYQRDGFDFTLKCICSGNADTNADSNPDAGTDVYSNPGSTNGTASAKYGKAVSK